MLLHNCKGMQTGRDAHREGNKIPTDLSMLKGLNRAWMMDHYFHSVSPAGLEAVRGKVEYQYADSVRAWGSMQNPRTTMNALQSDTCFCRHLAPWDMPTVVGNSEAVQRPAPLVCYWGIAAYPECPVPQYGWGVMGGVAWVGRSTFLESVNELQEISRIASSVRI